MAGSGIGKRARTRAFRRRHGQTPGEFLHDRIGGYGCNDEYGYDGLDLADCESIATAVVSGQDVEVDTCGGHYDDDGLLTLGGHYVGGVEDLVDLLLVLSEVNPRS